MSESIIQRQLKALAEFTDPGAVAVQVSASGSVAAPPPAVPEESVKDKIDYLGVIAAIEQEQKNFSKLIGEVSSLKMAAKEDKDGTKTAELHARLEDVDKVLAALEELYGQYKALHSETKSAVAVVQPVLEKPVV